MQQEIIDWNYFNLLIRIKFLVAFYFYFINSSILGRVILTLVVLGSDVLLIHVNSCFSGKMGDVFITMEDGLRCSGTSDVGTLFHFKCWALAFIQYHCVAQGLGQSSLCQQTCRNKPSFGPWTRDLFCNFCLTIELNRICWKMPFVPLNLMLGSGDRGYFEQHGESEETSMSCWVFLLLCILFLLISLVLLNTAFSTCFSCFLMDRKVPPSPTGQGVLFWLNLGPIH